MSKPKLAMFLLIIFSIVLAIVARFYKLGDAPAGLYLDEAGQGYSAYSMLLTGKDEFGKSFPIIFRSFTDFKTPVYIYILIPLIKVFGLTKFAVRLPSFIFSILTIPILYLLVSNLSPKKIGKWLGIVTIILLAISPWHVLFGRTNFEVNVSVFFLLAGILAFYKSIGYGKNNGSQKPYWLIASAVLLAIAIPAYHSQRIVTPLVGIILFIRHRKILFSGQFRIPLISGLIIGFLILLPTLTVATTPGFLARASGLNIFSSSRSPAGFNENFSGFIKPIINSRLFLTTKEFFAIYTSYFSPRSMFILGDSGPRSSFPAISTFFLWQFPFFIYGLYVLIKEKKLGEIRFVTLTLLIISPLPAAVTRDPYSTIRSLNMVIPLLVTISLGTVYTVLWLHMKFPEYKKVVGAFTLLTSLFLITYSLLKLWSSVIILNEHYRAKYWNYGWEQVSETIDTLDPSLPIIVDNARGEPYIELLFFQKFDPATYQVNNDDVKLEEYYTDMTRDASVTIGNITTRGIDWDNDLVDKKYFVGDALSISDSQIAEHNLELIRDIIYPDWTVAFRVIKVPGVTQAQQ